MPEYTFLVTFLALVLPVIDIWVVQTKLFFNRKFWWFQLVGLVLTLGFDGILENLPIVIFDFNYTLDIRLINIPIENFLFGACFLYLNVMVYERVANTQ